MRWLGLALAMMIATCAHSQDTGKDLLGDCRAATATSAAANGNGRVDAVASHRAILCVGYIAGVMDGVRIEYYLREYEQTGKLATYNRFCIPPDVTRDHLARVMVKFLETNPTLLHKGSPTLIVLALAQHFPCPK